MKERIVAGQHCLSLEDEAKLYSLLDPELETQIRQLFPILSSAKLHQFGELRVEIKRLNSLLWIYIQREGVLERVVENIHLLWVLQKIPSINAFAHKLDLNPSFTGRVLDGGDIGLGGWNLVNVMRMCGVLKVKPEVLLFADLAAAVRAVSDTKEVAND